MAQTREVRGVATSIRTENGVTSVRYHNTDVVRFSENEITLDSGGWQTATTKTRMNQAANQFDLGFQVYQKAHRWYVAWRGAYLPFVDGMTLQLRDLAPRL